MNQSKKLSLFLCAAVFSFSILFFPTTIAKAKADALVIQTNSGSYYEYNFDALKASAVSSILGDSVNGALYQHFANNRASMSAYHDSVRNVYVSAPLVGQEAVNAKLAGTNFNFDSYMESSSTPSTTVTTKKVVFTSGVITVDGVQDSTDSSDFDVSVIE